jgi:hypothetical protein
MLLATIEFVAFLLICHVIGTSLLMAVRLNVRGVVPPSALIGCGALGIQLWAFGFAHIPWNAFTLLLPWLAVWVVLGQPLRETLRAQGASMLALLRRLPGVEPLTGALIAISVLLVIVYALNAFVHPVIGYDAVAFWQFKAKLFFVQQQVDPATAALASIPRILAVRNQEYPPLYPLMLASTFVVSGRVNESLSNSINLLGLIAVVPTMYSLVRRLVGNRLAIALVFLLVAMALPAAYRFLIDSGYFGHADYLEACWIMVALIYLQAGDSGDEDADVMALAAAAAAALTKDEGNPLLLFVLAVLVVRQAWRWHRGRVLPARRKLVVAAVCVLPVIIWHLTWTLPGTITPLMLNHHPLSLLPQLPSRAATIGRYVALLVKRDNTYIWMWLALPVSLLLIAFNRFRAGAAFAVIFVLQGLAYFAVYLVTPLDLTEHLSDSADRVILQLTPALIVLVAVSLSPYVGPNGRTEPDTSGVLPSSTMASPTVY